MRLGLSVRLLALGFALGTASMSRAQIVDFESVPVGMMFGSPASDSPGDVVLTQEGIRMSVENYFLGAFTGFNFAQVGGAFDAFFPTTPLEINNISTRFDFTGLASNVTRVTIEYQEFGGTDNFAVNDQTIHQLSSLAAIPFNVAPGVTASVSGGLITLNGAINSVRIGGQELAIDNVTAVPEPGTALLIGLGAGWLVHRRRGRVR